MAASSSRPPWLIYLAFLLGVAAFGIGAAAVGGVDLLDRFFRAQQLLGLSSPSGPEPVPSPLYALARALALAFKGVAFVAVVYEISPGLRDGRRMASYVLRSIGGRSGAVVVGLGWVGGPLARDMARGGRAVVGVALREDEPGVREARHAGILVLVGDGAVASWRGRVACRFASEVFVATGDDARTLDVAAHLLQRAHEGRMGRRGVLHLFPHFRAADFLAAVVDHRLLPVTPEPGAAGAPAATAPAPAPRRVVEVHPFRLHDLAAEHLFLGPLTDPATSRSHSDGPPDPSRALMRDPRLVPQEGEVFHLVVVGFGEVAQAVALATARFAHGPSGTRPRLTILDPEASAASASGRAAWTAFLRHHPAFAPPDLDLTSDAFLDAGDGWDARAGQPQSTPYQMPPEAWVAKDGKTVVASGTDGARQVRPVEYAVNAEYVSAAGSDLAALILARQRASGPAVHAVKMAVVVALDVEEGTLLHAVHLRGDLLCAAESGKVPASLPLYLYLPTEAGLEQQLRGSVLTAAPEAKAALHVPVVPFGQRRHTLGHAAVSAPGTRTGARHLHGAHHAIRGGERLAYAAFATSNEDSARFADVKFDVLGLVWTDVSPHPTALPHGTVLGALMTPAVLRAHLRLDADTRRDARRSSKALPSGAPAPLALSDAELHAAVLAARLGVDEATAQALLERLAVLGLVACPPPPTPPRDAAVEEMRTRAHVQRLHALQDAAYARFTTDVGRDIAETTSRMEHSRYISERLAAGWRFGSRCATRRQRVTLVPWDDMTNDERRYDRIQIPRLLLEQGRRATLPDLAPASSRIARRRT